MIVNTEVNKTITSGNMKGSAMTVNITGTSFNFILDNLYTQPHRAVVRELSCNAWDAHVQAGNLEPFWIQVPSKFNQTFIIRDFGVGLDPDEIDRYLNTLYQSSKGDTNDQIGGFGLGAKSPFALVQSFFISSYKDGVEYKCFWYRDSEGIPVLKIQSQKGTQEPNGIKYIINFASKDVEGIIKACASELLALPVTPRFFSDIENAETEFDLIGQTGISKVVESEDYIVFKDSSSTLYNTFINASSAYSRHSSRILLSVGGVLYPLPASLPVNTLLDVAPGFVQLLDTSAFYVIKLPIGSVKLPSTREHILDITENTEIILGHAKDSMGKYLKGLKQSYLDFLNGEDIYSLTVHLKHLYQYCLNNSMQYTGAVAAFIDDTIQIDGVVYDFLQQYPEVLAKTTASDLMLETVIKNVKNWSGKVVECRVNLFQLKVVDTTSYKTSGSHYDKLARLINTQPKALVVFDNTTKFMGAWLAHRSDINNYSYIYRYSFNPTLEFYNTNHAEPFVEFFATAFKKGGSSFIKGSDIMKPPVVPGTRSTSLVPIPGIRVAKSLQGYSESYTNGSSPIYKVKDQDDKYIPFNSSYITAKGVVGYMVKEGSDNYLDYSLRSYFNTLNITTLYFVRPDHEQALVKVLKETPSVTDVIKVSNSVVPTLDHLDQELITQFFKFYQIWSSISDISLRSALWQIQAATYTKLDPTAVKNVITTSNTVYANQLLATIPDVSLRNLLSPRLAEYSKKYVEELDQSQILADIPITVLRDVLDKSLSPMMLAIVNILLNLKEE